MKTIQMTDALYDYVVRHTPLPHPQLERLIDETRQMPASMMQVSRDQGTFMYLFAKLIGAKKCLEVGCFTGFSAISVALALPSDGRLVTMDVNPETTAVARRYAELCGVSQKVDFRVAPALETFAKLKTDKDFGTGSVDLVFIDADKQNYDAYYEQALEMLRPGGALLIDNVLWGGAVARNDDARPETHAIRALNEKIRGDRRIEGGMLHISDGIYLCRKR